MIVEKVFDVPLFGFPFVLILFFSLDLNGGSRGSLLTSWVELRLDLLERLSRLRHFAVHFFQGIFYVFFFVNLFFFEGYKCFLDVHSKDFGDQFFVLANSPLQILHTGLVRSRVTAYQVLRLGQ